MDLTKEQQRIVNHPIDCHGRVLAGPGTGKSFTAVALVKKLYENIECVPKIKFITFTRAATAELAKKVQTTAVPVENPSTLHSFSLSILMQNPGCAVFPSPLRIPSNFELKELITPDLAKRLNSRKSVVEKLIAWMAAKWESLSEGFNIDIPEQTKSQFNGLLENHKTIFGYVLLQELPDLLRRALRDNQNLAGLDYNFIIVDEYQDLNACDLEIIKQFASRDIAILGIGDDDQSIYSGRCAEPAGIRRFLSDFSTDKDYPLTICHRCGKNILNWSQYVIAGDDTREIPKVLRSADISPDGISKLLRFRSNESEALGVTKLIKWLKEHEKVPCSEILILSRTDYRGAFSKPIKELLFQENIPISTSNIDELLNQSEVVNGLSLLRLLENENDSLAWWVLLYQTNNIGRRFIDSIYQKARSQSGIFGVVFKDLINNHPEELPSHGKNEAIQLSERVNNFLQQTQIPQENPKHWGQWIVELMNNGQLLNGSQEFKELLLKIDEIVELDSSLSRFLSQIYPLGKDIINSESKGVRFMTMKGSKGLTTKATIVMGVDNDLVPRVDSDLAEEHRLLYVAMTRSTDYLFLTWCGQRRGPTARAGRLNVLNRRQPSRFLERGPVESEDGDQFVGLL